MSNTRIGASSYTSEVGCPRYVEKHDEKSSRYEKSIADTSEKRHILRLSLTFGLGGIHAMWISVRYNARAMLHDFQRALLTLYMDKPTLDAFAVDPQSVLNTYSLTEKEQRALLGVQKDALLSFNGDLRHKRTHVVSALLRSPGRMVLLPFYETGAPHIAWQETSTRFAVITPGMFWLLHRLARAQQRISPFTLLWGYANEVQRASLAELSELLRFVRAHGLSGAHVMVL
jgi:hypothetical protein